MAYNVKVCNESKIILLETCGDLEAHEFHQMILDTEDICRRGTIKNVLVDHSASTVKNISAEEIHGVSMMCSILNDVMKGGKLAVVLVHDVDYGLGRMWESYTINKLEYDSRIFRNLEEAEEWIKNEQRVTIERIPE